MADLHDLGTLCRVCGERLRKTKSKAVVYTCAEHEDQLSATFGIAVSSDTVDIHPPQFCNRCYSVTQRQRTAAASSLPYRHSVKVFEWKAHKENECTVCQHIHTLKQGGGRAKGRKCRGRPPTDSSPAAAITHVKDVAPPPLIDPGDIVTFSDHLPPTLQCPICCSLVSQPVELACNRLVCATCCCNWIKYKGEVECPCCYDHHLGNDTVKCPSPVVTDLMGGLRIQCSICNKTTTAEQYTQHKTSQCQQYFNSPSPSPVSVGEILQKSPSTPILPVEKRVAESLIRRLMAETKDDSVIKVPTRGQPISLIHVTTPRVSTEEASQRTVKRRITAIREVREALSVDLGEEVRALPLSMRKELLAEAGLPIEIPANHALAMKANLSISWNKLRILRRWLKVFNISLASERKQRKMAKEAIGDNLAAEMVPFAFSLDDGGIEFREAPFVFVPNLIARVADKLNEHHQSQDGLTWHEGAIPSNEVWVKLGGDKGRGSFKFNVQVVNVQHPNSTHNTSLVAVFKAGNSMANLHTGLDQYREAVDELQGMKWRDWTIRVFFSGDYEFLCSMYGLSGASGRHNCLWCTVRSSDLRVPLRLRGRSPARSLESLKSDHQRFVEAGSNIKNAKEFNNAIREPFFSIPLDQVCIPGLHLSLGIFSRLFHLLEDSCQQLDLELAARDSQIDLGGPTFHRYSSLQNELSELRERQQREHQEATLASQLAAYLTVTVATPATNPTVLQVKQLAYAAQRQAAQTDEEIALKTTALSKLECGDGPFMNSLNMALSTLHVEKQAYHGGSFIGNHVHKLVQQNNAEELCSGILTVAQKCTEIMPKAREVHDKHLKAITLFGKCHNRYNGGVISDEDINKLERDIEEFLVFYRTNFPNATVLPKMHILEDHVIPWLRKNGVGSGLMSEQGAESIHAHLSKLETQYSGVANPLERLKYVFNEHNIEATPALNDLRPPVRKKKKNSKTASIITHLISVLMLCHTKYSFPGRYSHWQEYSSGSQYKALLQGQNM